MPGPALLLTRRCLPQVIGSFAAFLFGFGARLQLLSFCCAAADCCSSSAALTGTGSNDVANALCVPRFKRSLAKD